MNTIPILMYHNIGKPPRGATYKELYVSTSQFKRHMFLLKIVGFRGISMTEALPYFAGEKSGKVAVITFDDGYVDNLVNAAEILKQAGFTATCYIVSRCVGTFNTWDAQAVHVKKQLMNREQLRCWTGHGMEIGAHTQTHTHLTQCDTALLEEEIVGCKRDIESITGVSIRHFCYPYGSWNMRVAEVVRKAGFLTAVTTRRGRAKRGDRLLWLSRVKVRGYDTLLLFALKLLTAYEDRRAYDLSAFTAPKT